MIIMKVKIEIDYYWKCDSGIEIPKQHKEALKEDAEKRIFEMVNEGYHQGELNTSIRFGKEIVEQEDAEDGLTYSGWWSAQKKIK